MNNIMMPGFAVINPSLIGCGGSVGQAATGALGQTGYGAAASQAAQRQALMYEAHSRRSQSEVPYILYEHKEGQAAPFFQSTSHLSKIAEISPAERSIKEKRYGKKKKLGLLSYKPIIVTKGPRFRFISKKNKGVN